MSGRYRITEAISGPNSGAKRSSRSLSTMYTRPGLKMDHMNVEKVPEKAYEQPN